MNFNHFSLEDFISKNIPVDEDNAFLIIQELVEESNFSKESIDKISQWLHELPDNQKEYLFEYDDFLYAFDVADFDKYVFEENDEHETKQLFQSLDKINIPVSMKKWILGMFCFPKITAPSGVYLYVERENFIKNLIDSIEKYPHIIDELKLLKLYFKKNINIVPDQGYFLRTESSGTMLPQTSAIQILNDRMDENTLETILHELGHLERKEKYDIYNSYFTPLMRYVDEAEQFAKSFFMDGKTIKNHPVGFLTKMIENDVKKRYPSFDERTIQRVSAILMKRELVALFLMERDKRDAFFAYYENKGVYTEKAKNHFLNDIDDAYNYYSTSYSYLNSSFYKRDELKDILFKRYKKMPLIEEALGVSAKHLVLNDAYLDELNRFCAYVDEKRENPVLMGLDRMVVSENKVSIFVEDLDIDFIYQIKDFYKKRGVDLVYSKKTEVLYTKDDVSISYIKHMTLNDENRTPIRRYGYYVKIDDAILKEEKKLAPYLEIQEKEIKKDDNESVCMLALSDGILVRMDMLNDKLFHKVVQKQKIVLACEMDYIENPLYEKEIKSRFLARGLPVRTIINDEENQQRSLILFQKKVLKRDMEAYFDLIKSVEDISKQIRAFNGVKKLTFVQNKEKKSKNKTTPFIYKKFAKGKDF